MTNIEQEIKVLTEIKRLFFLLEPIENKLKDLIMLNKNFNQQWLLSNTLDHEIIKMYPNKIDYSIKYLKSIISELENYEIEVEEIIYNKYFNLINNLKNKNNFYYKHFENNNNFIVIKNNYNIISEGTTGLCIWEGALVLAAWCLQNETLLKNKTILELGCGIGFTGINIILNCICKKYIFTDSNLNVLEILKQNLKINLKLFNENKIKFDSNAVSSKLVNGIEEVSNKNSICDNGQEKDICVELTNIKIDSQDVHDRLVTNHTIRGDKVTKHLNDNHNCNENTFDFIENFQNTSIYIKDYTFDDLAKLDLVKVCDVDYILGSDIIYDKDLFPNLIEAIINILNSNGECVAILACKIRNDDTFQEFLKLVNETKILQVCEEYILPSSYNYLSYFNNNLYSSVKILCISKKK